MSVVPEVNVAGGGSDLKKQNIALSKP